MRVIFYISDPWVDSKSWYVFIDQALFPMRYIKQYIEVLYKYKTSSYQYTFPKINWSGTYMRNNIYNYVQTKLLILTTLISSGPEIFLSTMVPVMLDTYDALETTLAYMKNIKLVSFPGENIANF